jgi:hypothetical protein
VALLIDKRRFVRAAALASIVIAAILGLYIDRLDSLVARPGSAVSLLLIVPGLLAYLLVRPAEHPLVGQFLRGLRYVLMASGTTALTGAGALVMHGPDEPSAEFRLFFFGLFLIALICAGVLVLSVLLPLGRSRRPLSAQATKAITAPRGRTATESEQADG